MIMAKLELNQAEVAKWRKRTPRSQELWEKSKGLIPTGHAGGMGYFLPYPIVVDRAKGCWLWDVDGNRYLDLRIGDWVLIHGHCDDDIRDAVMRQMERHTQVGAPEWDCAYRMAEHLVERTPSIEKVRFFASGTDANLAAIRMARVYTGRTKVAKAIGSYHGTADVLLVGQSTLRDPSDYVPAGVPARAADEVVEFPYNDPDGAASILEREGDDIAAILLEPCLTAAGMIEARREFLQRLREVATRKGIVLIFDEVVTYPVAYGGAQVYFDVIPDLTTLGKAIGGGVPASAVGGRAEFMNLLEPDANAGQAPIGIMSTFGGNSIAMAAGVATMQKLTRAAHEKMSALGNKARDHINQLGRKYQIPLHATGLGHLVGVHWADKRIVDYPTRMLDDREKIVNINLALDNEGYYQTFVGAFLMSTAIGSQEIDGWLCAFERALHTLGYVS
jgi:glutamate-1-semialdehyde 2,1-aminomutase